MNLGSQRIERGVNLRSQIIERGVNFWSQLGESDESRGVRGSQRGVNIERLMTGGRFASLSSHLEHVYSFTDMLPL